MLNKLIENFDELMIDSFANYLCQKLIKVAKDDQIDQILLNVSNPILNIYIDPTLFCKTKFRQTWNTSSTKFLKPNQAF